MLAESRGEGGNGGKERKKEYIFPCFSSSQHSYNTTLLENKQRKASAMLVSPSPPLENLACLSSPSFYATYYCSQDHSFPWMWILQYTGLEKTQTLL